MRSAQDMRSVRRASWVQSAIAHLQPVALLHKPKTLAVEAFGDARQIFCRTSVESPSPNSRLRTVPMQFHRSGQKPSTSGGKI
ncbi:MAG TPA: hypothetical protein V6D25_29690 [Leptolyngbyaceae cyanobacterium]